MWDKSAPKGKKLHDFKKWVTYASETLLKDKVGLKLKTNLDNIRQAARQLSYVIVIRFFCLRTELVRRCTALSLLM